ncbi:phosphonate ABC transporter, permease protein PhnE [Halostella sp. JP-L12]|uniref:phosphonate ABC transporter, permease protein PhnE n=1 Tax=Halostella TaxID=1843185 RepID=UPI000EF81F31|nr:MULTISPECIES: phosphonate ABC transporter, permease protein PhnE [Halostella]NHN49083.1 phosphonate ABC transporter, permease protein PhnE [Halostella sp. JP-L12]
MSDGAPNRPAPAFERDAGAGVLSKRRLGWLLGGSLLVLLSAWVVDVDAAALVSPGAREQMAAFVAEGIPPDVSRDYLLGRSARDGLLWAVVETLGISVVATALAVVLAVPLALLSAAPVTHRGPLYADASGTRRAVGRAVAGGSRFLLSFLRSVPGLVWGFLFVTAVGLGPFAGALALGVHNAGVLGKLYADFLEDTDPRTTEAVAASGATRFQAVCHGMVPQVTATVASYTLYRWECTIRSATILGFVGAGGIGYYLVITIQRLQYPKLVTAIAAVFALVALGDALASRLRQRLT